MICINVRQSALTSCNAPNVLILIVSVSKLPLHLAEPWRFGSGNRAGRPIEVCAHP